MPSEIRAHPSARRVFCPSLARWLSCITLAAALANQTAGAADARGRIIDSVVCRTDAAQSYALYVPSTYTQEKPWPVILCFDPGARGRTPVERFQAAAEKFGYVVAGSLNSRNGPYEANIAAARAMLKDLGSRLRLDPGRVYSAGLSGGARVATQLALMGLAHGVIACSAGFPDPVDGVPLHLGFPFYSTTGTEDFNQSELRQLDALLEDRKATHRLIVFTGGHEWASATLLGDGVAWLHLQAMRTGAEPRNEATIQTVLQERLAALPVAPAPERWRALQALAADFNGLADTAGYGREAKTLADTREVKQWQKGERARLKQEQAQREDLAEVALNGSPAAIQKMAAGLRQAADAADDSPERQMARRVIGGFSTNARETIRVAFEQEEYATAAGMLEAMAALHPGQSRTDYDLARARALDGDRKRALAALVLAVDAGYRDLAKIQSEPAFKKLTGDPGFRELVAKIESPAGRTPAPEGAVADPDAR